VNSPDCINFLTPSGYPPGRESMRKAPVLIALILLLTAPTVHAGRLLYYPDREAFRDFLNSSSSYTVVPGDEDWARGWAYYVDERLATVKPRGRDTIVLVGNVYDNELMASLWKRTGLPENASLRPSVIVLNNTVLITGSEDNIYLTEEAFRDLWNPSRMMLITFLLTVLVIALIFSVFLGRDGSHAGKFYLLTLSLYALWYLLSPRLPLGETFLRQLLSALTFAAGGSAESPLSAIMGAVFRVVPPLEETLTAAHWVFLLLVISLSFYLAPRKSRELGFLIFGLTFSAPLFREMVSSINGEVLGLTALMVTLAMITNLNFPPGRVFLQTVLLSLFTLLAIAVNPYLVFIPIVFAVTFPGRHFRNHIYLLMTVGGTLVLYLAFPNLGIMEWTLNTNPGRFILDSGLSLGTIVYVLARGGRRVGTRGHTPFLMLSAAIYLPLSLAVSSLIPHVFVILSALAVRLLSGLART